LLPFVNERRRALAETSVEHARAFLSCGSCLERNPEASRRSWNCGHLPRLPQNPYAGPSLDCRLKADTVCPGYLVSLPQVIEASHAHVWFDKGQLTEFCDGKQPTRAMRDCVDILDCSIAEANAAAVRNAKKGKG
jgi:hypothetical protein